MNIKKQHHTIKETVLEKRFVKCVIKRKTFCLKNKEIQNIFLHPIIINYCKSVDYSNWEELRSELIIQLYKIDDDRFTHFIETSCLIYISLTIIKRIKCGTINNTGIFFHKLYELTPLIEPLEREENKIDEKLIDKMLESIDNLFWYNKYLFKLYYIEGKTLKQISEETGINIKSIHYNIKITKQKLQKKLKKFYYD